MGHERGQKLAPDRVPESDSLVVRSGEQNVVVNGEAEDRVSVALENYPVLVARHFNEVDLAFVSCCHDAVSLFVKKQAQDFVAERLELMGCLRLRAPLA